MASEAPDPKSFSSWEDAFQYPIPAVRGMEKQLRRDIDSNREKLRTLVGASYRDLLSTADSIVSMDKKMHDVETLMGELGRKCNTRLIDRKITNYQSWTVAVGAKDSAKLAFTSQLSVLRACPDVISSLLRTGGSLLLAAKVLVISRLLHTKLSKPANPPPYLEKLRNRLATLRRKLLGRVDRRFKSLSEEQPALVEAMCAFSLATSSGPSDLVKHFHHLRSEAIREGMRTGREGQEGVLQALRIYVRTLQDTQAIVPAQLARALQEVKSTQIVKGSEIQSLVELNLDIHERWLGEDVRGFTPYVRHDELTKPGADKTLKAWARPAIERFLEGLRARARDVKEPEHLMQLRNDVLELWLGQRRYSLGVDAGSILDGLRDVFNERGVELFQERAAGLHAIGQEVDTVLKNWEPGVTDSLPSLWSSDMTSMDTGGGAKAFRQKLMNISTGKNDALLRLCSRYNEWLQSIESVEKIVQDAKKMKWTDDLNDVDDEDDLLDDIQVLLSQDDPRTLGEALQNKLQEVFVNLDKVIDRCASRLDPQNVDDGRTAVFLLRTCREIRQHLPSSFNGDLLGETVQADLLTILGHSTTKGPLDDCSKRLKKLRKSKQLPTRALWEGDPELPVLPSPWAYRLLLEVTQTMAGFGTDIWNPSAVAKVKEMLQVELVKIVQSLLSRNKDQPNGRVNGETKTDSFKEKQNPDSGSGNKDPEVDTREKQESDAGTEVDEAVIPNGTSASGKAEVDFTVSNDISIQVFFDLLYICEAVIAKKESSASRNQQLAALYPDITAALVISMQSEERMKKHAVEYWGRTNLLFGLLA